jgi:glutamine synthetase
MADSYITFCNVARTVAARYGLFASFMPKPLAQKSGSGLHVSLSLYRGNENVFKQADALTPIAQSFIQGILNNIAGISAFLNPLPGSYTRLGHFDAPAEISWSHQNRAQLIRIPAAGGHYARMELRSPDPSINPYAGFALLIQAGLDGIERELGLQPEGVVTGLLPGNLGDAIERASSSDIVRAVLPDRFASQYLNARAEEYERMVRSEDARAFEMENYFSWA